jgi:YegS/Rv2252/BmrU family lipid kinase
MSISIVINPVAGGYAGPVGPRVDLVRRVASECGEIADVSVTEARGHARALAKAARANGARLVVAWGGDGTINEVASELAFSEVALGIVPGGSGNGLARELGLTTDPERALRNAITGVPKPIDTGEIEGRLFVNLAGIGFDAHVAEQFNASDNRRRGPSSYIMLTARSLMTYQPHTYDIVTDGERINVQALLVVIANGTEFGNRMLIAPDARVDDGRLDVVVVEERSRAATIYRVPWLVTRSIHRAPAWSSRPTREVAVGTQVPMMFHVDGESVQGGTTLRARIHPASLRVTV